MRAVGKTEYLDMSVERELQQVTRIAYVHDYTIGMSKFDKGYVKFFLKDCNADIVTAMLFDVEDFSASGINASALKHNPIIFSCKVQSFNGRLSLLIDGSEGIKFYDGVFDYERFIGKVGSDLSKIPVDQETGRQWQSSVLDEILSGKIGGYAKLVEIAYAEVSAYFGIVDDAESLRRVFLETVNYYHRYLEKKQKTVGSLLVYDLITDLSSKHVGDEDRLVILDAFSATVGIDQPKHLYAHIVQRAMVHAGEQLALCDKFGSMVLGTECVIGGATLLKY